jgi:hypothetical protein
MSQKTTPISSGYLAGYVAQSANAVAIGNNAGSFSQGAGSVAIGFQAGQHLQGVNSMAIGYQAGVTGQGSASFAMGYQAGLDSQGNNALAIGYQAGQTGQGAMAESIGYGAGQFAQGTSAIAIGYMAGNTGQGQQAQAIGHQAGASLQGTGAFAVGFQAGMSSQGAGALALGYMAGTTGQNANTTAVGYMAGAFGQNANAVALGYMAGTTGQGTGAYAIGTQAGNWNQGQNAIAMGFQAGMTGQGANAVAVGFQAGATGQSANALAVGFQAGEFSQGLNSIAMGTNAGMTGQSANALAVGANAGAVTQGAGAVAFGTSAGQFSQGANALAMGHQAGMTGQKANAVAIGFQAGQSIQGDNAFAMGNQAGMTGQGQNAVAIGNQAGQLGQGVNAMAVGFQAGMTGQGTGAFAMGFQAGNFGQGVNAMAVGFQAGMTGQKPTALALGYQAGLINQGTNAMAVGYGAGMYNQGDNGFAVGFQAGVTGQGANTLAMGYQAGAVSQGTGAIAVGYQAGMTGQKINSSAIGYQAGQFYQGAYSVAIGFQAGMTGQQDYSAAIGNLAGQNRQGNNAFALGSGAGQNNQGQGAVALGTNSGNTNQGQDSFAAGVESGFINQGMNALAIGWRAGRAYQGTGAFAAGYQAGFTGQNANAAAIGWQAGMFTQGTGAFALGYQAGMTGQGLNAVALGYQAGQSTQGNFAVAVGNLAGVTGQNTNAVAIGNFAGQFGQGAGSVAIGFQAGVTGQKANTVAIGNSAGQFNQGANALAIGFQAGMTGQNDNAMALGNSAGQFGQGTGAFAIGFQAGVTGQRANAMAIGFQAGELNQGANAFAAGFQAGEWNQGTGAFALGFQAGQFTQGANTLALGFQAGITGQGTGAVAMGFQAGELNQGTNALAIGYQSGEFRQGTGSVAMGFQTGQFNQGTNALAVGFQSGVTGQGTGAVAMGFQAGELQQGTSALAIGFQAGELNQGTGSVAMGFQAGQFTQGANAFAVGFQAGITGQGTGAVAMGFQAGELNQGANAFAVGYQAGELRQGANAFAAGYKAGQSAQGAGAVAIGFQAGCTGQGANSIAIGNQAGVTGITPNSIVLNASGAGFFATGPTGAFYVSPVSTVAESGMIKGNILVYGENNQIMKTPATIDKDGGFFYTNSTQLSNQTQLSSLAVSDGRVQTALTTFAAGNNAGMTGQNDNSVALGMNAGQYNQSAGSIALGYQAGQTGIKLLTSTIPITSGKNMCMSGNGQYQLVASAALMLSTDTGASFTSIPSSSVIGTPDSIAMSTDGRYMLVSTIASPNTIYLSTNFGGSWSNINNLLTGIFNTSVNSAILSSPSVVGISGSTMIITSNLTSFQSSNNGVDWSISKQMVTQYFPFDGNASNAGTGSPLLSLASVGITTWPLDRRIIGTNSAFFENSAAADIDPTSYMHTPLGWTWNKNLTFTISCRFLVSTGFVPSVNGSIIWGIGAVYGKNTYLQIVRSGSNLILGFGSRGVSYGPGIDINTNNTITTNKWYNAVVTLKSGVYTVYLDGVIVGQASTGDALVGPDINHLTIGACLETLSPLKMFINVNGSSGFNGCIDDFRIYEGVDIGLELTQDISTTTRLLNSVSNTYPIQMYTGATYPSFLACINADTDSLNLANGSTGSAITDSILRFSGTSSYKFSSGGTKSASIILPSSFTISCVLLFNNSINIPSSVPFALVNSNDSTKSIELFMNSGGTFHVATGSSPASSAPLFITGVTPPINTWYYIAITVSSAGINIYINGYLNGSFSGFNSQTSAIYGNTVNLVLGALNTSGSNPFNGNIDDFRIYNGVLSEAQIGTIYTDMSYIRPLRYASFDLGNSNLLSGYFPSTAGVGSYGGDGTTKVSGNFSLRVNTGGAMVSNINNFGFSVSFWLRFNTLKNRIYSFPFLIEANSSEPNVTVCERFGKLYLRYYNEAWTTAPKTRENFRPSDGNGMPVATATWYHITVVNDYHSVFLYVNGALLGSIDIGEKMNWNRIYISRFGADDNFDGWIDEYRFYQASLSSYQVTALYTNNEYNFKNTSYSLTASPSNKYQLYTNLSNKVYLSKDSGSTSTEIVLSTSNYTPPVFSPCMSSIGQYMAFCTTKELYYSMNYGNNWTILKILTGADTFKSVVLSDNGFYLYALYSSGIYVYPFSGPKNIAIGYQAGQLYQGSNSIAIGNKAGNSYQPPNTIILNANDTALNASTLNGCFIAPIASFTNSTSTSFNLLGYGSDNQIVKLDTSNLTLTDDNRNWVTMRGKNLNIGLPGVGVYPTAYFGDQSCSIGWNFMGKGGETTFMNNFTGNEAFNFIKRNGTDSHLDLATINAGSLAGSSSLQFVIGNASQARNSALAMYSSNNTYMYFACQGSGARTILYALSPDTGLGVQLVDNTTGWSASSDERIKLNITPLPNSLSSLLQIKTINYNLLNDTSKRVASGLSVQNLQSIPLFQHLPIDIYQYIDNGKISFVDNGTDSIKSLIYNEMIPYIIKALQEHVQEQRSENADLKAQLASLKATVDALVTQKDLTQIASSTSNPTGSTGPSGSV